MQRKQKLRRNKRNPEIDSLFQQAIDLHQNGELTQAANLYQHLLQQNPKHADALHLQGLIQVKQNNVAQARESIKKAIKIDPKVAAYHYNLGVILQEQGNCDNAVMHLKTAVKLQKNFAQAYNSLGIAYLSLEKNKLAQRSFESAIKCNKKYSDPHNNLAKLDLATGQQNQALAHLQQALSINPHSAESHDLLGNVAVSQNNQQQAIEYYQTAIKIQADYYPAYNNLANILSKRAEYDKALQLYDYALQINPLCIEALCGKGKVYEQLKKFDKAYEQYRQAVAIKPNHLTAYLQMGYTLLQNCQWDNYDDYLKNLGTILNKASTADTIPLQTLNYFPLSAKHYQRTASIRAKQCNNSVASLNKFQPSTRTKHAKLRIGYVSANFCYHAVGTLIQDLFQYHNSENVTTYAYSLLETQDDYHNKIQSCCDLYRDISQLNTQTAAQQIYDDEIDVLIDMMGYTQHCHTEIFALQPAPIQISYLGFLNTMHADFIDYILADEHVVPDSLACHYNEKVIYLADSFCVASPIATSSTQYTRADYHLPEDAFVFCCFNDFYKLEPHLFNCWLEILSATPESVLWLCDQSNTTATTNLTHYAKNYGIAANRIIFCPKVDLAEHIARSQLADLFLDTLNYNAGATGVCALWAGLPILTCTGNTYLSRMGTSLNHAIGLSEMVCTDLDEYKTTAIELALNSDKMHALKKKLWHNRESEALFNTQRFAANLEKVLLKLWDDYYHEQSHRCHPDDKPS